MKKEIEQYLRLHKHIQQVETDAITLMGKMHIQESSFSEGIVGPKFTYSDDLKEADDYLRRKLILQLEDIEQNFYTIFNKFPDTLEKEIEDAFSMIRSRLELKPDWLMVKENNKNIELVKKEFDFFLSLVGRLEEDEKNPGLIVIVPDADSFIEMENFDNFGKFVNGKKALVVVLEDVYDQLEAIHDLQIDSGLTSRTEVLLKSLRKDDMHIELHNSEITFSYVDKLSHDLTEYDWLHEGSNDAYILLDMLQLKKLYSSAFIILMTSNIDLQNKAELLGLPFVDPLKKTIDIDPYNLIKDLDISE